MIKVTIKDLEIKFETIEEFKAWMTLSVIKIGTIQFPFWYSEEKETKRIPFIDGAGESYSSNILKKEG